MTFIISEHDIYELCGITFASRGKAYYTSGAVKSLTRESIEPAKWTAIVHGTTWYNVVIAIDDMRVSAGCTCPAYSIESWCKHVAAGLFAVRDQQIAEERQAQTQAQAKAEMDAYLEHMQSRTSSDAANANASVVAFPREEVPNAPDTKQVARLIELFRQAAQTAAPSPGRRVSAVSAQADRTPLQVEFIISPEMSYEGVLFRIGMKVGPQRTYVVKDIRGFLEDVEARKPHVFTPKFTYDDALHCFQPQDRAVISLLLEAIHDEAAYVAHLNDTHSGGYIYPRKERSMAVPPAVWERLLPRLLETTALMDHNGSTQALSVANGDLPITASLTPDNEHDGCKLHIEGMDALTLLPRYHCAVHGNSIYPLDELQLEQLSSLHRLIRPSRYFPMDAADIFVPSDQLTPFINEVVPGLRRLGQVQMDSSLSQQLVEEPLSTRLYLDREDDTLLARLEFAYGNSVIQPFIGRAASESAVTTESSAQQTAAGLDAQIVVRDLETETRILQTLEDAGFTPGGSQLELEGESEIYNFVFAALPVLRDDVEIYATAAVDGLLEPHAVRPRSRVELDKSLDWLQVSFDMGDLDDKEVLQVLKSMVERKKYHRLKNGSFVSLENQAFEQTRQMLDNLGLRASDLRAGSVKAGNLKLPALRALPFIEEEPNQQSGVKLGKSLRAWLDNLRNPDNLEFELPPSLAPVLRDYQKFGFQWLKTLSHYGFGGILADDMGLGKTLQSIAYLLSERTTRTPEAPALIVCPASLTYNWLAEIEKFAPELKAAVINGDREERFALLADSSDMDVLITSYPLLWRDAEAYAQISFDTLILDEAQAIKNHNTQTAQAVSSIQSPRRFALTGTPVENSLDDLWSVFYAIFPALLGPRQAFSKLAPETVARRIRPFMLRRLKRDVLSELPDKIEMVQTAEMNRDQKKHYLAYLSKLQDDTAQQLETEGFQKGRFRILAGLTRLRQICCHPALAVENYNGASGKLDLLMELVDEYIGANQRMLIFSQFTSMLAIIQEQLNERNIPYYYLDGQTPAKERLALCQRFNEGDTPVFLISLKAGGTGLNLTGADTVILYDLWWNPAVEEQAADRAHRIGQKHTVQVIRMVTNGTIEEKMYELQEKKRALIDQVVASNATEGDDDIESSLSALTEADIRELLAIR